MSVQEISAQIEAALRAHGRRPSSAELDREVSFVVGYVKQVPAMLVILATAARARGQEARIQPLLAACEQYWRAGLDLIPDHHGLAGLMDDAYYTLSIIQGVCDQHRNATGQPLLGAGFGPKNRRVRGLIGEPHASALDAAVAGALGTAGATTLLRGLQLAGLSVGHQPIWGDSSVDQAVDVQLRTIIP